MLVELVAQPICLYLLCTKAIKYVYTHTILIWVQSLPHGTREKCCVHVAKPTRVFQTKW